MNPIRRRYRNWKTDRWLGRVVNERQTERIAAVRELCRRSLLIGPNAVIETRLVLQALETRRVPPLTHTKVGQAEKTP